MTTPVVFVQNDNLLEVKGLKDEAAGSFINSSTDLSVTVKDLAGVNVPGETWPVVFSYVAASNGDYRATLQDGLSLVSGREYIAEITFAGGPALQAFWKVRFSARTRTG